MSVIFHNIDRKNVKISTNVNDLVPENSLARFIVNIIEKIDISPIENTYVKGGSKSYPPKMMLALLFYCYINGINSSRKMEQATFDLIPVIYITGGLHPDHDTINTFRKRFLDELNDVFVQILEIAHAEGILNLKDISGDGTKILANASKHKAMSWKYACQSEQKLISELDALRQNPNPDEWNNGTDIDIEYEIKLREQRLKTVSEVKQEIEKRAADRHREEMAEYNSKIESRRIKEETTGKKIGGKKPSPPEPGPRDKDQVNFTDPESRIMKIPDGDFGQAYNAQTTVDMDTMLIVGNHVTANVNDKQELVPALDELAKLPRLIGQPERGCFDNGFFSESNVTAMESRKVEPYIASGREPHTKSLEERFSPPPEPSGNPGPVQKLIHRLKTAEGRAFYALRKSTVEPVFGIIKEIMGFRRFRLRGLEAVTGEWNLVCIAFNLKRLHPLMA